MRKNQTSAKLHAGANALFASLASAITIQKPHAWHITG